MKDIDAWILLSLTPQCSCLFTCKISLFERLLPPRVKPKHVSHVTLSRKLIEKGTGTPLTENYMPDETRLNSKSPELLR